MVKYILGKYLYYMHSVYNLYSDFISKIWFELVIDYLCYKSTFSAGIIFYIEVTNGLNL